MITDRSRDPLAAFPVLRDVPVECRTALAQVGRETRFAEGERLVSRFNPGPRLLFLLEGIAELSGITRNGVERILHVYRPGEIVGSRLLLATSPSDYEVTAMTTVRALAVERGEVLRLGERHPELLLAVTREFTGRLTRLTERFMETMTTAVPVRMARILLDFADENHRTASDPPGEAGFARLVYPLTHGTMARIVGASRPHVSAVLADLEAAGAVRRPNPRGLLVHPGRLREIVARGEFEAM